MSDVDVLTGLLDAAGEGIDDADADDEAFGAGGFFGQLDVGSSQHRAARPRTCRSARVVHAGIHAQANRAGGLQRVLDPTRLILEPDAIPQVDLGPEDPYGSIEFKLMLLDPTPDRLVHLCTQMNFRLTEGAGRAVYEIGVHDGGRPLGLTDRDLRRSIATVLALSRMLDADCYLVHVKRGLAGLTAQLLVKRTARRDLTTDVRICVAGATAIGKSTLIGVLSGGVLDNGKGSARTTCFRHRHELANGRTSCISRQLVGFDDAGRIVTQADVATRSIESIATATDRLLTLIDLAGHERHLRTALYALTSQVPDYSCVALAADRAATADHLSMCIRLRIPTFIVVTRSDLCSPAALADRLDQIRALDLHGLAGVVVDDADDDEALAASIGAMCRRESVPILVGSSTTGYGLQRLQRFLQRLPKAPIWAARRALLTEFCCDDVHSVGGVGTVLSGIVLKGAIDVGQSLQLGPDDRGRFRVVQVASIHVLQTFVQRALTGQAASIALVGVERCDVRKGVALLHCEGEPAACVEFVAVVHASAADLIGRRCVVHVGTVQQVADIVRCDDRSVAFRFAQRPEYVPVGSRLIFRDDRLQGIGFVTAVVPAERA